MLGNPVSSASRSGRLAGAQARTADVIAGRLLPMVPCVVAAIGVWLTFYPGLLSPDSLSQYGQALQRRFDTWHAPVIAVTLSYLMRAGVGVGAYTLVQSLAGLVALQCLVVGLIGMSRTRVSSVVQGWTATAVTLALLVPLSPLPFYLVTVWGDAALTVSLLWTAALAVWLFSEPPTSTRGLVVLVAALATAMAFALLTRHNALILLPAFALLLAVAARPKLGRASWLLAAAPALLALAFDAGMHAVNEIHPTRLGNVVKAHDLLGVCKLRGRCPRSLPYTASQLTSPKSLEIFAFGNVWPMIWMKPPIVRPEFVRVSENAELDAEWWRALLRYPRTMASVKLRSAVGHLGLEQTGYWFQAQLDENEYGLVALPLTAPLRQRWIAVALAVKDHPVARWVSGAHVVWLSAGLIALGVAIAESRRTRVWFRPVLLLVPFTYAASFIVATTAHDFRFLYPSTLLLQAYLFAAAAAFVLRRFARERQRPSEVEAAPRHTVATGCDDRPATA